MLQPQSDLSGVIQVLVCVFGEDPPVFSKSQSQPTAAAQQSYPAHVAPPPQPPAGAGYAPYPTSGVIYALMQHYSQMFFFVKSAFCANSQSYVLTV